MTLPPEWTARRFLEDHFRRHGAEVGARTLDQYVQLAHDTIRNGIRFTFRQTSRHRVAYFHPRSRRFVILTDDEETILSLSRKSVNHIRNLPDSTYGR